MRALADAVRAPEVEGADAGGGRGGVSSTDVLPRETNEASGLPHAGDERGDAARASETGDPADNTERAHDVGRVRRLDRARSAVHARPTRQRAHHG